MPRTTPMRLISFIDYSYVIPWDPIWVLMYGSRHLNVYWSCEKKYNGLVNVYWSCEKKYNGLDHYFHCMTLCMPRTTPIRLISSTHGILSDADISFEYTKNLVHNIEPRLCVLFRIDKNKGIVCKWHQRTTSSTWNKWILLALCQCILFIWCLLIFNKC